MAKFTCEDCKHVVNCKDWERLDDEACTMFTPADIKDYNKKK